MDLTSCRGVNPYTEGIRIFHSSEIELIQLAREVGPPYPWQMAKRDETIKVEVQAITDAGVALSEDQAGRMKRYFASMMIRTACFILAVILPSPYRWFALAGAVTLPYIAVVVANAGRETIFGRAKRLSDSRGLPSSQ